MRMAMPTQTYCVFETAGGYCGIAWSGEGITDPRYLTTDDSRAGVVEGKRVPLRLIQKRVILKRSEVL